MEAQLFPAPQTAKTSDDYYTPAWIFEALALTFDLDVASPPHATHVPCDRYFTVQDDGLAQEWQGRVWMNPPFSKPTPWIEKWLHHGNGLALTPMSKSKWFASLWNDINVACVALPPTLKFVGGAISFPTMLWAIGHDNIRALNNLGAVR